MKRILGCLLTIALVMTAASIAYSRVGLQGVGALASDGPDMAPGAPYESGGMHRLPIEAVTTANVGYQGFNLHAAVEVGPGVTLTNISGSAGQAPEIPNSILLVDSDGDATPDTGSVFCTSDFPGAGELAFGCIAIPISHLPPATPTPPFATTSPGLLGTLSFAGTGDGCVLVHLIDLPAGDPDVATLDTYTLFLLDSNAVPQGNNVDTSPVDILFGSGEPGDCPGAPTATAPSTETATSAATDSPTAVPDTPTPTNTTAAEDTETPMVTDTPVPTDTETPSATNTVPTEDTATPSATDTAVPGDTATATATDTATPATTDTAVPADTDTPTATATGVPDTATPTATSVATFTPTNTATATPAGEVTHTVVATKTVFGTRTAQATRTIAVTRTPERTTTPERTNVPEASETSTPETSSPTVAATDTATPGTDSCISIPNGGCGSETSTSTPTTSPTAIATSTPTTTATQTATTTASNSSTAALQTSTPVPTSTATAASPQPASTQTAVNTVLAAQTGPTSGGGSAAALPNTGAGSARDRNIAWLIASLALAAGSAGAAGMFVTRRRQP